jgi:hypothetical protein
MQRCGGVIADKLGASKIDLNGDGLTDLLVQGTELCTMGAHSTSFWLFTRTSSRLRSGYELAFRTDSDSITIRPSVTNGYHDIVMAYATGAELMETVLKFDGSSYQRKECSILDFRTKRRQRVRCIQPE